MDQKCTESNQIILIRHAESEYNVAKHSLQSDSDYDPDFDPELIDCSITEKGIQQCQNAAQKLKKYNIVKVFISPLKRALKTAIQLFQDHPNKPKMIVEPLLKEMFTSADDLGGRIVESYEEMKSNVDFSRIFNNDRVKQYPYLWSLEYCFNDTNKMKAQQLVFSKQDKQGTIIFKFFKIDQLLELIAYMKSIDPEWMENYNCTRPWINELKEILKLEVSELGEKEKIACVSHFFTIRNLTGSKYDKFGKPRNGENLNNCEFVEYNF